MLRFKYWANKEVYKYQKFALTEPSMHRPQRKGRTSTVKHLLLRHTGRRATMTTKRAERAEKFRRLPSGFGTINTF